MNLYISRFSDGVLFSYSTIKKRKIWPKALPHYVLIFQCHHQEMYYYFVHLPSSCYIMPLFLLLISPSALTLSDLYFRNTLPGQKQYSNMSPRRLVVVGFLVPLTQFIFVFSNTSPAHKLLNRTSPCRNNAGGARPHVIIYFHCTSPLCDPWNCACDSAYFFRFAG